MRYVDITKLEDALSQEWHDRATAALDDVRNCTEADRSKNITARGDVWRDAGKVAATLADYRCWYCDLPQVRSDMPVDHFRPKGRVAEDEKHPGYWWLAFSWQNFRYACTFCNSRRVDVLLRSDGGKQDHFPLLDGCSRACCEEDDLGEELPALLDPAKPGDPGLLTFRQDGRCVSHHCEEDDPVAAKRVKVSVHLYHLDHPRLRAERRKIWKKVDQLIQRGEERFAEGCSLDNVKSDLHELIRSTSPLCRVARLALRGRRDLAWVRHWLDEIVTTL